MTKTDVAVDRIDTVVEGIKLFQDAVDKFDTLAAEVLQVNATDLRCLTILRDKGPLQASAVASALGLTRGSTTTALRRMESMGYIARAVSGRHVTISLTGSGAAKVGAIWAPTLRLGRDFLGGFTDAELSLLLRFLEGSLALQETCLAKLREEGKDMARIATVPSSQHRMRQRRVDATS